MMKLPSDETLEKIFTITMMGVMVSLVVMLWIALAIMILGG